MSRATIRQALYNFFGGSTPSIDGLKTVYMAQPKEIAESQMPTMFFTLPEDIESRHAAQQKIITYNVYILLAAIGTDTDSQTAEQWFENIVDAVKAKIRTDKTLGGAATKFGETMQTTIDVQRDNETVLLNAAIRVETEEWVNA